MVSPIPMNLRGIQKHTILKMLGNKEHVTITVVHEIMLGDDFKVMVNCDGKQYTLYTFRAKEKRFSSLATIYKFCQELGIREFQVIVKQVKDGVN